eukprot:gene6673-biopygen16443
MDAGRTRTGRGCGRFSQQGGSLTSARGTGLACSPLTTSARLARLRNAEHGHEAGPSAFGRLGLAHPCARARVLQCAAPCRRAVHIQREGAGLRHRVRRVRCPGHSERDDTAVARPIRGGRTGSFRGITPQFGVNQRPDQRDPFRNHHNDGEPMGEGLEISGADFRAIYPPHARAARSAHAEGRVGPRHNSPPSSLTRARAALLRACAPGPTDWRWEAHWIEGALNRRGVLGEVWGGALEWRCAFRSGRCTGQGRAGQDRTAQDRTGQGRTRQDRTGQVRTGQDRAGQTQTKRIPTPGIPSSLRKAAWGCLRSALRDQGQRADAAPARRGPRGAFYGACAAPPGPSRAPWVTGHWRGRGADYMHFLATKQRGHGAGLSCDPSRGSPVSPVPRQSPFCGVPGMFQYTKLSGKTGSAAKVAPVVS